MKKPKVFRIYEAKYSNTGQLASSCHHDGTLIELIGSLQRHP